MKRRNLIGVLATALGSSLAIGSGAFNTARADRNIDVDTVTDENAYLKLNALATTNEDGDTLGRSSNPGKQIQFDFPGTEEESGEAPTRGDGLGTDSEYYFHHLVEIENQGTNPIIVYSESSGEIPQVALYDSDSENHDLLVDEDSGLDLGVGEAFEAGVYIDTTDLEPEQTYQSNLSIIGIAE